MRREHNQAHGVDDFVTLGLIAASYGVALALHGYGFLAVFAAGLSMRHLKTEAQPVEKQQLPERGVDERSERERNSVQDLMKKVPSFNLQMERIGEVAVVIVVGALLQWSMVSAIVVLFALTTFLLYTAARRDNQPVGSSAIDDADSSNQLVRRPRCRIGLLSAYVIGHGLEPSQAATVANVVLPTVALSVVVHGVSVTPFMLAYNRRRRNRPAHA